MAGCPVSMFYWALSSGPPGKARVAPFPMYQEPAAVISLLFGYIVGHIIQNIKAQMNFGFLPHLNKGLPHKMGYYLPVGKG